VMQSLNADILISERTAYPHGFKLDRKNTREYLEVSEDQSRQEDYGNY